MCVVVCVWRPLQSKGNAGPGTPLHQVAGSPSLLLLLPLSTPSHGYLPRKVSLVNVSDPSEGSDDVTAAEGERTTVLAGEAVDDGAETYEVNSETIPYNYRNAYTDDISSESDSKIQQITYSNRDDGKRNKISQSKESPGNTHGVLVDHSVGSNTRDVLSMVQSLIEDLTRKQRGDHPDYIVLNSPDPTVTQQLAASLTRHYGSHSVIQDTGTIQSIIGSHPHIWNTLNSSSETMNHLPVFPNEFTWNEAFKGELKDPEVDYMRQKLAAVAHVSVSSGKLINDTLQNSHMSIIATNSDANIIPATSASVTDSLSKNTSKQNIMKTNERLYSSLSQEIQNQFISDGSMLTPEQTTSLEIIYSNGHLGSHEIHRQLDENVYKPWHLVETSPEVPAAQLDMNDSYKPSGIYINNIFYPEATFREKAQNKLVDTTVIPIDDAVFHSLGTETSYSSTKPSLVTWINHTKSSSSTEAFTTVITNNSPSSVFPISEFPKADKILNDNSAFRSEEAVRYAINKASTFENEVSASGYEDYYEEIDGELILSPTKFMRKGESMASLEYGIYEDYYLMNDNENFKKYDELNTVFSENKYNVTDAKFQGDHGVDDTDTNSGIHPLHPNSGNELAWPYALPPSFLMESQMSIPLQTGVGEMIPKDSQILEELWKMNHEHSSRMTLLEKQDRIPAVYNNGENPVTRVPSLEGPPSDMLMDNEQLKAPDLKTLVGGFNSLESPIAPHMGEYYTDKGSKLPNLTTRNVSIKNSENLTLQDGILKSSAGNELEAPVRLHFSGGNYRKKDLNVRSRSTQQILLPTEAPHPNSEHQENNLLLNRTQLTQDQEEITSRLPVEIKPDVSLVMAVQAPPVLSTTTVRPYHYQHLNPMPLPFPPSLFHLFPGHPHLSPVSHVEPYGISNQHNVHASLLSDRPTIAHGHSIHSSHNHGSKSSYTLQPTDNNFAYHVNTISADTYHGHHGSNNSQENSLPVTVSDYVPSKGFPIIEETSDGVTTSIPEAAHASSNVENALQLGIPAHTTLLSSQPPLNHSIGEFNSLAVADIVETSIRHINKLDSVKHINSSQADRNQDSLQLDQDSHVSHSDPFGGDFVNYRPPQQSNMQMEAPIFKVTPPEVNRTTSTPTQEEPNPLSDPGETPDDTPVTSTQQTIDREGISSLLQSLFSSSMLLLLGILLTTSVAYIAKVMDEQAAQQRLQQAQQRHRQAQLAAAFGNQHFFRRKAAN